MQAPPTRRNVSTIAIGIQNGARTQTQGQLMTPVSFKTTKAIPRDPVVEAPVEVFTITLGSEEAIGEVNECRVEI